MRMVRVFIDDPDFLNLGFNTDDIFFSELKEKLSIAYAKEALLKCNRIAKESGLAEMSFDEINAEIQNVRDHAKNRH